MLSTAAIRASGTDGTRGVRGGAEQAGLLGRESHEQNRAAGRHAAPLERLRRGEHGRGARRVVLRAVVERVAVHRRAVAEVVVVRPDHHHLVRAGAAAGA